ncbi:DUF262 domain-containing protein [Enterococcus thailandicus]|uniref:DUF262 domain-containing protein n=1 Tax=Enterococcus thailandicus TaxID=417368 RepID=UPI0039A4CA21
MAIDKVRREVALKEINKLQKRIDYDTRDFPISFIVEQFLNEDYYIPDYQREFVWPEEYKARFIESLILGYPIPLLFLADTAEGRLEIVDGVQRISTLSDFLADTIILKKLTILKSLNGFKFSDLPISEQRRLKSKSLRVIVLRKDTELETRTDLFNRLNTSAFSAKGAEVRRGAYKTNALMQLINKLAQSKEFSDVVYLSDNKLKRREDTELVSRFFAYLNNYQNFVHSVTTFINEYIVETGNNFDKKTSKEFENEFKRVMRFAKRYYPNGFSKVMGNNRKDTPRVRFESLAVGTALALREDPDLAPSKELIEGILSSDEFNKLVTSDGSNSKSRVRARIEFIRDALMSGNYGAR